MRKGAEADDEPLFANLIDDEPALAAAVVEARKALHCFKAAAAKTQFSPATYLVKVPFIDRSDIGGKALVRTPDSAIENETRPLVHLWLCVTSVLEDLFFCSIGEAPEQLHLNKGDSFVIEDKIIEDWMINHQGAAYGGFSLRVIWNRLREMDRNRFHDHTGIRHFKEQMP
jgi:hypothetical protein